MPLDKLNQMSGDVETTFTYIKMWSDSTMHAYEISIYLVHIPSTDVCILCNWNVNVHIHVPMFGCMAFLPIGELVGAHRHVRV